MSKMNETQCQGCKQQFITTEVTLNTGEIIGLCNECATLES
jgi:NAD-dependent SIR2 family protein deacetylase